MRHRCWRVRFWCKDPKKGHLVPFWHWDVWTTKGRDIAVGLGMRQIPQDIRESVVMARAYRWV